MRTFGYQIPPKGHHKPLRLGLSPAQVSALPGNVDLTPNCPEVYDQGSLGSCTAHALVGGIEYLKLRQVREGVPVFDLLRPSRLGLYYDERNVEGTISTDAGAVLSDGVRILGTLGYRTEDSWPYDVTKFADYPAGLYETEKLTAATALAHDLDDLRAKLALGYPVAIGATVYGQIMDAPGGAIAMPDNSNPVGGHAVLLVGYDDGAQVFRVRNSWGTDWGHGGYGTIPYAYVVDLELTHELYSLEAVRPV